MNQRVTNLSNTELMLLQIIEENGTISGYQLNKLVEEMAIRDWADIGTTSIYVSLKKLEKKEYVSFFIDKSKTGKGPPPKKYNVSTQGKKVLTNEILRSLSTTPERDKRFDLAFNGISFLPRVVVILALEKRIEFLAETFETVEYSFEDHGGENLPLHQKAVYEHRLFSISNEIEFMQRMLILLKDKSVEV